MTRAQDLSARRAKVVARGVGHMCPGLTADRANGATILDADGREMIDFAAGIGVCTAGHCQPQVARAIQEQAARLMHACIHVATYEPYVALCEKLVQLFPHGPETKVFLTNTGAEAIENAIKIARQHTGRPSVIAFTESFHGRTMMALALTSKVGYKLGCGPLAPEVYRLPYPNFFKYGDGLTPAKFVERELARVRQAFTTMVPADQVAAIVIEPVQGEGGFVVAPPEYLRGLRAICDEHGIVLICDEVQTGFFRTGTWAAYHHSGVTPDLSTWAKALGGGLPIACVIGKASIMDAAKPGTLGGTYGGNPVACAGALANIALMQEIDLGAKAAGVASVLKRRLEGLRAACPLVGDVRGLGPMLAMELVENGDPSKPATSAVAELIKACLARGVILASAGVYSNVVRFLPPLVIPLDQLERGLGIVEEELLRIASAPREPAARTPAAAGR